MYLDNAATTPLSDEVKEYLISILDYYGNPSSNHSIGDMTKHIIDESRENVRKFINASEDDDIIFTSSGSSANTLAIKGLTNKLDNYILYCSPIAHKSMMLASASCQYYHKLKVNKLGEINIDNLEYQLSLIRDYKPIVCIDVANSEIGTIQNVTKIEKLTHKHNGIIICDFTGYIPSYKVDVKKLNIDIATFSGHKLHALKGIGVLYKKKEIELEPLVYGSQEQGLFAGTENFLAIASLGKAIENYDYSSINCEIRDYFYNLLISKFDCYLVGSLINRLPHNLFICFKGIDGFKLKALLDMNNIQVSNGSACNSGSPKPSNTLIEIGLNELDLNSCIRITFSGNETYSELNSLCDIIEKCINYLK